MPHAHITHHMRGRVRFQVPSMKNDHAYFERVGRELAGFEGVDAVRTNARTGSVLVLHRRELEDIRGFGIERGLFTITAAAEAVLMLADRLSQKLDDLDDNVIDVTRGNLDLKSVVVTGLLAGAAVQVFRKHVAPPAFTLLWYALAIIWPGGKAR